MNRRLAIMIVGLTGVMGSAPQARAQEGNTVNLSDTTVDVETRVKQAKALAQSTSPQAIDELLTGLNTRSEPVRDAVIASLKAKKGGAVLLARAADVKRPAPSRVAALGGVRVLKPENAGTTLSLLLDDKNEAVREAAAYALCVVGAPAAEAKLIAKIKSEPSAKVRSFIAVALGELRSEAAKAAVAASLKTETDVVVQDALDQAQTRQAQSAP
jgi:HEAT repeat protein